MPTYEYACKACGHNFDIVQSFSEDALTTCPECAEDQLRKVYNAAGIIFKGDGWHIKDYASSSSSSATAGTSSSTSSEGSSDKESSASTTKGEKGSKGEKGTKGATSSGSGDGSTKSAAG